MDTLHFQITKTQTNTYIFGKKNHYLMFTCSLQNLKLECMFLICSSLMVSPCHGTSWMLLCCIWRQIGKL